MMLRSVPKIRLLRRKTVLLHPSRNDEILSKHNTEDLLLACTGSDAANSRSTISELIKNNISFGYLSDLAKKHRVSTLVHRALKFYAPISPEEGKALKELQISCLASDATNGFYRKELMVVLSEFDKRTVPVIPIKGMFLSERLYGDIVSRDQSVDLDLLVREEDLGRARGILEAAGYTYGRSDEVEKYQWSCSFTKLGSQTIDLHWDITMMVRSRERIEALWRTARAVLRDGIKYYKLAPEELLLYLSAHLVSSGSFRQIRHVCDIDRLIRKYGNEIDWDSLVRKAKEIRLSGSVYASLKLAKKLYGTPYPKNMGYCLKVPLFGHLLIQIFAKKRVVLSQCARRKILDIFLSYILFELIEARSFTDHARIIKRVIFPAEISSEGTGYVRRFFKGVTKLARQLVS